jgi:peroxiredoxin
MALLTSPAVKPGWQAQSFELADPDGNRYSLEGLLNDKGLLIAFICNHCPYVKAIADRLAADAKALQQEGINVVAINPNDYHSVPADSPPMMKRFAAEHDFSFPYLIDEDQSVARAYDAVCTPDFFGLNSNGELQYRGRLDDARMEDASERTPELVNAMRQVATTGTGPETQYPSMGCSIKWRPL